MITYAELQQKEMSENHRALLSHVKELVALSREHIVQKYIDWDHYDDIYRGVRAVDTEDKKAIEKRAPKKMVVPIGYAQLQTFIAFCFSLFTQREFFYELIGSSPEDFLAANKAEALLQRDLDHNKFPTILYQFLLDIGRFGLGVIKCHWVTETQMVEQNLPPKQMSLLGLTLQYRSAQTKMVPAIKYQGNKLMSVSPYRFFPDPRLPLSRFQEGEFVASEEEYTKQDLKKLEKDGVISGVDFIEPWGDITEIRHHRRPGFVDTASGMSLAAKPNATPPICITEVEVKIIPKDWMLGDKPLGPEDYPIKYLIWYANDQRIVRCEPLNYLHDRFTYEVAEMTPDMNHFLNSGILETIDELQDVISWFINSHITSVRRVISNKVIVDPAGVEMDDLANHRPVIRLKPDASRSGVDRWIKQMDVHDVTQSHIGDANQLEGLVQLVTGINDNLLGQYNTGRRSATEARNVTASAASRLKMYAALIFSAALEPLGRQMLSNQRDGLTVETFVRMFGSSADPASYQAYKRISKSDLVGDYDFAIFDGTLPSEKGYMADVLIEFLTALLSNPQAIMLTGLDPKLMVLEALRLKGVRFPERFEIQQNSPMGQQMIMGQQQLMNGQQNTAANGNNGVSKPGQTGPAEATAGMADTSGNDIFNGLVPR